MPGALLVTKRLTATGMLAFVVSFLTSYPVTGQPRFELPEIELPNLTEPAPAQKWPGGRDPWSVTRPPEPAAVEKKDKEAVPPPAAIDVCTKSDDSQAAFAACTQILENDSEKDETRSLAFLGRARINYLQHEKIATLADLNEAVRLNPQSPLPVYRRGRIWLAEQNYDQAIKDFSAAFQIAPRNGTILIARALAFRGKGDHKRAIGDLTRALALDNKSAVALYERGVTYLAAGDGNSARKDLVAAAAISPKSGVIAFALGNVESHDGNHQAALSTYEKAIALDASIEGTVLQAKGSARQKSGDCFGAIHDFTRAVSLGTRTAELYKGRGACLREVGELDESLADLNRAIQISHNNPDFFAERGVTQFLKKDSASALKDFDLALKMRPALHLARLYRARLHLSVRNAKLALPDYDAAISAASSPEVLAERAWVHLMLSDHGKAAADVVSSLAADPLQPLATLAQGYLEMSKGNSATAEKLYVKVAKRNPSALEFIRQIGVDLQKARPTKPE